MERIRGSPFLSGQNDRGWCATLEWFLRPDIVFRILEGQYDGIKPTSAGARIHSNDSEYDILSRGA